MIAWNSYTLLLYDDSILENGISEIYGTIICKFDYLRPTFMKF